MKRFVTHNACARQRLATLVQEMFLQAKKTLVLMGVTCWDMIGLLISPGGTRLIH